MPKIRFKPRIGAPSPSSEASSQPVASPEPAGTADSLAEVIPPPSMANPHIIAPSPPNFETPPAPINVPPLFVGDTPPAAPSTPAAGSDSGKFKLKPKSLSPIAPPPSDAGAPPFVFAPAPVLDAAAAFAPPPTATNPPPVILGGVVVKAPPPFPVMAPAGSAANALPSAEQKTPVPDMPASMATPRVPERRRGSGAGLLKLVALIVLAGGGFMAWQKFKPAPATPAPAAANAAPVKKAPVSAPANPTTTPSETLNEIAHAPKKAIDKAQEAIAARRASGQSRIDAAAIGEDLPHEPVAPPPAPVTPPPRPAASRVAAPSTTSTIAPGISATAQVEAAPEASAPFRTFVANAKVSGVFQGPPTRAMINGRLIRSGELVDAGLGITFNGVDSSRRQLIFQDKSGATVSRRF